MVVFPAGSNYYLKQSSCLAVVQSLIELVTSLVDTRIVLISSSDSELAAVKICPHLQASDRQSADNQSYLQFPHVDWTDGEISSGYEGQDGKGITPKTWIPCSLNLPPLPDGDLVVTILGLGDRFNVICQAVKDLTQPLKSGEPVYQINFNFEPAATMAYCQQIPPQLAAIPEVERLFLNAIAKCSPQPNLTALQSEFTLRMLAAVDAKESSQPQNSEKLNPSSASLSQEELNGTSCFILNPTDWSHLLQELQRVNRLNVGTPAILQHSARLICQTFAVSRCLIAFYSARDRRLLWGAIAYAPELKIAERPAIYPKGKVIEKLIQQQPTDVHWTIENSPADSLISSPSAQNSLISWLNWEAIASHKDGENTPTERPSDIDNYRAPLPSLLVVEQWDKQRDWHLGEMQLLQLALHQVQLAVEQATLYQEAEERANREALLNRLVASIRASLELSQIFETVTIELGQLLVADRCTIFHYLEAQQLWQPIAEYRANTDLPAATHLLISEQDNPLLSALHALQIVEISDTRFLEKPVDFSLVAKYPGSWLLVPIQHQEKLWGCLAFAQDKYPRYWHKLELNFLETVAAQLAIAIYQATLYQQIQQQNQNLAAQVQASTAELESFFDAHPDYIFVVDCVKPNHHNLQPADLRLRFCNHAFAQGFGFDNRSSLQGRSVFECFPPLVANSFARQNLQVFASGETLHEQETLVLADGTHYFDTFRIPLKQPNGEVYACLGTARDITELVKTKEVVSERTEQLQDALSAAKAASQAKSNFLATMSHELRTPLTSVIGMSSALLRQYLGTLNSKQVEYVKIIHDSGQHLLELINDILDLSKIEAGKASLEISNFCLYDVAYSCLALLREKAETKKVHLTEEFTNLSPSEDFSGDERRVKQILLNLLSNAVKFTPPEGQVCLRIRQEGNTAIIEVVDNGIGIPEHKQHLVFERFEQLNHHHEGTGLGLALTRQLVEMHGGTIEFTSAVGEGTAFIVRLQSQPQS